MFAFAGLSIAGVGRFLIRTASLVALLVNAQFLFHVKSKTY